MNQKKQSSLSRILGYAGGHKNLTLLGCILSALSAVLGLIPYVCVWLAARNVLEDWPGLNRGYDLSVGDGWQLGRLSAVLSCILRRSCPPISQLSAQPGISDGPPWPM